jgi:hypothetical protein
MDDSQRVTLMLETAIDLAMDRFDLSTVLREFAKVRQFRALGDEGYPNPMREALIKAKLMDSGKPNEDEVAAAMAAYRQTTVITALEPTSRRRGRWQSAPAARHSSHENTVTLTITANFRSSIPRSTGSWRARSSILRPATWSSFAGITNDSA